MLVQDEDGEQLCGTKIQVQLVQRLYNGPLAKSYRYLCGYHVVEWKDFWLPIAKVNP